MSQPYSLFISSSNLRLIDAICTPRKLADRARDIGLKGICFTEHECLSESIEICEMRQDYPELKLGIGNEIYLCDDRSKGQHYNHFILVATTPEAHKQLRILSSRAWMNSYFDRGMERVVTTKDDLTEIVKKNPGELIATSACLSSELSVDILKMENARAKGNKNDERQAFNDIQSYIEYMLGLFGDNFYLEIPPGASNRQIIVNKKLLQLANYYHIKYEISCDSHYVSPEDRFVHKSFLLSKGGEREDIDDFYSYSYLQDTNDIIKHLTASFGNRTNEIYNNAVETSKEIYDKIEEYDLRHAQTIPQVPVPKFPKKEAPLSKDKYPNLVSLYQDDNDVKRYWVNECINFLHTKGLDSKPEYLAELEKEADIKRVVGNRLHTNMYAYPVTLKYYIDLIWECGSTVGAGRGSSCSGLNHWALGITQYDPLPFNFPFERYMNWETRGLGDIDLDLCNSKRPIVLQKIKEERGARFKDDIDDLSCKNLGCTLVATFGTASTKRAIQIACAGYRSDSYPEGIDIDEAKYISSLIPSERGFLWKLSDVYYGNKDKGRKPQQVFINEVSKFPGLFSIMEGVEGLIVSRGSHASGVILLDEDPYEFGCFMKTPSGDIITQYDLEGDEAAGLTKYDSILLAFLDNRLLLENTIVI